MPANQAKEKTPKVSEPKKNLWMIRDKVSGLYFKYTPSSWRRGFQRKGTVFESEVTLMKALAALKNTKEFYMGHNEPKILVENMEVIPYVLHSEYTVPVTEYGE